MLSQNANSENAESNSPPASIDPMLVRKALARRLYGQSTVKGQITLAAVPSMVDEYVERCAKLCAGLGRKFSAEDRAPLKTLLEPELVQAYAASQRAKITISFEALSGDKLRYFIQGKYWTVEGAYENWIGHRKPPLFGSAPDARVWALANEAADPSRYRVLDIGAGTGRNALALARRGHPVNSRVDPEVRRDDSL